MTALGTVIGRGTLAARPAAGIAGQLYFATDGSGTMYRDNGATWDSVETSSTGVSVMTKGDLQGFSTVAARIPVGADAQVLTADSTQALGLKWAAAAGGGVGWTNDVNETGASFANFTAATGTWSSNGTEIIQTDTAASPRRVKYNTLVGLGYPTVLQVEVQIVTAGAGGLYRGGLLISDGSTQGGLAIYVDNGASKVAVEQDSVSNLTFATATISLATWYTLRIVMGSAWYSVYLGGVLKFSFPHYASGLTALYPVAAQSVGLLTYAASVKFRNFKVWTLSTGAP